MPNERITHLVHHADPNVDRGSKRETVIKHQKSTAVSVSQVSTLALELSRQADGTISPQFEENCERAFEMLIKYQAKLNKMQDDGTES